MEELPAMIQDAAEPARTFWQQVADFLSGSPEDWLSWEVWLVATLVLLLAEVMTAGFVLAAFTPGTVLATVVAALGASMPVQVFAFSAGTVLGLVYLRPLFLRRVMDHGMPTNVDALVGADGDVVEAIPAGGVGRVKLRSEEWRARSVDACDRGARVRVVEVEGNTLLVARKG
jgi:membrane protein implicated in regulation of membrane protease activity